jgi:hypothetical protein
MNTESTVNPFVRRTPFANAVVLFWVQRLEYVTIGKRAAKHFLNTRMGEKDGKAAYERGYILCDTLEDANAIHAEMLAYRDSSVSQYVFAVRVYADPKLATPSH